MITIILLLFIFLVTVTSLCESNETFFNTPEHNTLGCLLYATPFGSPTLHTQTYLENIDINSWMLATFQFATQDPLLNSECEAVKNNFIKLSTLEVTNILSMSPALIFQTLQFVELLSARLISCCDESVCHENEFRSTSTSSSWINEEVTQEFFTEVTILNLPCNLIKAFQRTIEKLGEKLLIYRAANSSMDDDIIVWFNKKIVNIINVVDLDTSQGRPGGGTIDNLLLNPVISQYLTRDIISNPDDLSYKFKYKTI
jgi:hypothetical protein